MDAFMLQYSEGIAKSPMNIPDVGDVSTRVKPESNNPFGGVGSVGHTPVLLIHRSSSIFTSSITPKCPNPKRGNPAPTPIVSPSGCPIGGTTV